MTKKKKNRIKVIPEIPFLYKLGVVLILLLPVLNDYPLFAPPAFSKGIVFRIMFLGIALFFLYDLFFKKEDSFFKTIIPKIKAKKGLFFFAPLLLLLWLVVATIFSIDPNFSIFGDPLRGGGFLNFSLIILFGYFLYFTVHKKKWSIVWNTLFFTGIITSLIAIMQWQGIFFEQASRPPATLGNPTILGIYLATLVFPLLYFILKEKRKIKKYLYGASFLLIMFGLFLTLTRAAFLGVAIGLVYFVLFYPKKTNRIRSLKIGFILLLIISSLGLYYVNTNPLPSFAEKNETISRFVGKLDVENALRDPRIGGFAIGWEAIKAKPVVGYGPDSFAYAFDKHYYSEAPFISRDIPWWDKAHNFPIEVGVWGGFPAMGLLLFIFGSLFWILRKEKKETEKEQSIEIHTLQATIITFFVANLFTVDDFTIYLLFAVIMGQIFSICCKEKEVNIKEKIEKRNTFIKYKNVFLFFSIIVFIFFANFNLSMLFANRDINVAESLSKAERCPEALELVERATEKDNPISFYLLFQKAIIINNCIETEEEKEEILNILKEASKKRPLYTRAHISVGTVAVNLILSSENKEDFVDTAIESFSTVSEISPYRHESYANLSILYIIKNDFEKSLENANICLEAEEEAVCYFSKGFSLFVLGNEKESKENIEKGEELGYETTETINKLIKYQVETKHYEETVFLYLFLIDYNPDDAQNYSSLATVYRELEEYEKAREWALKTLEISPQAKKNVREFLKTLPD
ncbi:MAG: O-antigen ligase family protein [Patescibacteria group bacterium]|nr:O-antigen ligase family protein [Patescibacteria group bacterium]